MNVTEYAKNKRIRPPEVRKPSATKKYQAAHNMAAAHVYEITQAMARKNRRNMWSAEQESGDGNE